MSVREFKTKSVTTVETGMKGQKRQKVEKVVTGGGDDLDDFALDVEDYKEVDDAELDGEIVEVAVPAEDIVEAAPNKTSVNNSGNAATDAKKKKRKKASLLDTTSSHLQVQMLYLFDEDKSYGRSWCTKQLLPMNA